MRVCNKCHKTFDDSWKICLYCSQELEFKEGEYRPVQMPEKLSLKRELSIILSVLGILFLLFWGLCGQFGGWPRLF